MGIYNEYREDVREISNKENIGTKNNSNKNIKIKIVIFGNWVKK